MINIKTLDGIGFETIHNAFIKAFADYEEPNQPTLRELKYKIERRGCNLALSFGAFDNDEPVGFTLNCIGEWNGQQTAYDTGTGIIKEFRKQGIAKRIFDESVPILKQNKVDQYLLEVIKTNTKAFDLYRKTGFEVVREFDYYISSKAGLVINTTALKDGLTAKEISAPDCITNFLGFYTILAEFDKVNKP